MKKHHSILCIHEKSHIGGGQTYVWGIAKALKKAGVKTEVIEDQKTFSLLWKMITSPAAEIIWHVYSDFPLWLYVVATFLGKKNTLIVYGIWTLESRSSYWSSTLKQDYYSLKQQWKLLWKQYFFFLGAYQILHLSEYAQTLFNSIPLYKSLQFKKQKIIYGGVEKTLFKPFSPKQKHHLREKWGIEKNAHILLMVGRVEKRKNYRDAVQILAQLHRQNPREKFYLYFVFSHGDFNDELYLRYLAAEVKKEALGPYVKFIFGATREQLAEMYQIADAFLMLSVELETFGLVTLEALASGCPVFGYNTCATPEIVTFHQSGFLFAPKQKKKLTQALAKFLLAKQKNHILQKELPRELSHSVTDFNWKNVVTAVVR